MNRCLRVTRREAQHRARIQSTTEITTHRNVGPHAQTHRLIECVTKLFDVKLIIARRRRQFGRQRIIEIPITLEAEIAWRGENAMPRRHLINTGEKRALRHRRWATAAVAVGLCIVAGTSFVVAHDNQGLVALLTPSTAQTATTGR